YHTLAPLGQIAFAKYGLICYNQDKPGRTAQPPRVPHQEEPPMQAPTRVRPLHPERHAARVALLAMAAPAWGRGFDRDTGERVHLVPSETELGKFHVTTLDGCDCKGWQYRGACSHHSAVVEMHRQYGRAV